MESLKPKHHRNIHGLDLDKDLRYNTINTVPKKNKLMNYTLLKLTTYVFQNMFLNPCLKDVLIPV